MDVGARMGHTSSKMGTGLLVRFYVWATRREASEVELFLRIFFGVVEGASLLGVCGAGRGIWCGKDGHQDGGTWSGNNHQSRA